MKTFATGYLKLHNNVDQRDDTMSDDGGVGVAILARCDDLKAVCGTGTTRRGASEIPKHEELQGAKRDTGGM